MALKRSFGLPLALFLLAGLGTAGAQTQASRVAGDWRSSAPVVLAASKPPLSPGEQDLGAVPGDTTLQRMLLLLQPSAEQQQALAAELANLRNPASPSYHQWLTPQAFAGQFANSAADVNAVASWLASEGFQVAPLPAGRGWIEFSGTVAQAEQAFHTQIHLVGTAGGVRPALVSTISVPAALQPLIAGLVSLDGAVSAPALTAPEPMTVSAATLAAETSPSAAEALTPALASQLLDLNALTRSGVTGSGQTIAIAARSDVNPSDVAAFRSAFHLPVLPLAVTPSGADPGLTSDQAAATLAASWAGAAAPGAQILLVPAATTNATDGVDLSLAAIVDQRAASIATVGYEQCEAGLSTAHQAFYAALYQQAAAEGISVVAAVGDSGAAACAPAGGAAPVSTGYAVNALASTPWDTAVGVASFGTSGPATTLSSLSAWSPVNAADPAYAGGGGSSALYAGPKWQPVPANLPAPVANSGLPNRLLPDLSLPTAIDTGTNPGLAFCFSGAKASTGCTLVRSGGSGAAASLFAGIAALVAQKNGTLGNLAPHLYAFNGGSGVFNDVSEGSAQLKCAAGSPGCNSEGEIGFTASSGYDLTTGLGVPDGKALVSDWAHPEATGTGAVSVSLSVSPTEPNSTYNPSATITFSSQVLSETGGTAPTGTVTFFDTTTNQALSPPETIDANGDASVTLEGEFASGGNEMVAEYSGDTNYAATNSTPPVNINTQASTTSMVVTPSTSTVTPGETITATVTLTVGTPAAGSVNPAGVVTLNLDGGQEVYTGSLVTSGGVTSSTISVVIPTNSTLTTHTLQAVYNGNTDYSGSTSPQITLNVTTSTPVVTVTPATTSPLPNSQMQVTIAVAPQYNGETPPTGTVTLTMDGVQVGAASLVPQAPSSLATVSITTPASGTHTLQASYSGDSYYSAQTSSQVSFTVSKDATTTVLTPATTSVSSGNSLQVSAAISASPYVSSLPTGTVSFLVDGTSVATATVISGSPATVTTTLTGLSAGSHTLEAVYSGDSNYATSTSAPVSITVAKTPTTLAILPATTTPAAGSSLQVTATISASTYGSNLPSGTVTFTLNGATVGTANVVPGQPSTASVTFTVPSAGNLTLQATYSGDSYYASSTATSVTLNATKSTPTIIVTPATTTPAAGSSLQLSASISPTASGATAPTGTVTFLIDGNSVGTALVSSGSPATATLTTTTPGIGTHTVTAVYSGDGNYNTVTSAGVPIIVGKATTTLAVTPSSTSPIGGSTMVVTATLTATVSGTTIPTGTVSFLLDGSTVGTGTLQGGTTASISITVPTSGTHSLQASYSGDTNYNPSTSPLVTFTVAKTPTTLVVVPATTTPALGATLQVTATVTPSTEGATPPSGTITFTVDGVAESIQTVTPGTPSTATVTLPALSPGAHTIAATYSGDAFYATSTASGVSVSVPKSPTSMTITPATITPSAGGSLAVSATITVTTTGPTLPSGTVSFTIDGATVATAAVVPGSPATASATLPSTAITPGTHILQATYSGDSYYASSTSQAVTLTISKSPTTTTLIPSTLTPSAGGSMVVTVNITSANPSTTAPSGTVTISVDGVAATTATVVPGTPSVATATLPLVSAGTHVLEATYSGDTNYTGSSSSTVTITASKGATVTTLAASPASLTAGMAETLTATIAPTNPVTGTTYTFSGTVSFYDGTTLLGQVAVVNGTATLTGVDLKDNVSHNLTAVYSGDTNWLGSTSSVVPLEATTLPDTVVLTSNFTTVQPGVAVVLTATVTPNTTPGTTGEQNPTGQVVFYDGTTVIGTATLSPVALSDASTATLTIQTLPGGQDTVSAYYEGDLYYDAATSNLLSLVIEAFTITPSASNPATNLNIVKGGAGTASFDITGEGGFDNEVQVVCAVPTQDDMTCTATPQQVTPPGTVTFVIQTYTTGGPSATASLHKNSPLWPRAAGGAALAGLLFFLLPFGKRTRIFLRNSPRRMLILLLLLVGLASTGIGCTSNQALVSSEGTPLGVATLKITGSAYVDNAVVSQSVYLTVDVIAPGTVTP